MAGAEGFVGLEAGFRNVKCIFRSSDQLHEDLDTGIGNDFFPVGHRLQGEGSAGFRQVTDRDSADLELDSQPLFKLGIGEREVPDQTGSHRSATDQSDPDFVHGLI